MLCCKKCQSAVYHKSGMTNGHQRYKCQSCGCNFTDTPLRGKPMSMKTDALRLYLEGLGFRAIGRFLQVSNVAVLKWIKKWGVTAEQLHKEAREARGIQPEEHCEIECIELDEMWSYLKKNSASVGYGLLWIPKQKHFLIGKREIDQK